MPGFDGTGPMGMGPMTGGARGVCNPNYRQNTMTGFRPGLGRGGGRGRGGYRNMYWTTGVPGWMRSGNAGLSGMPYNAPDPGDQEIDVLKTHAKALETELEAVRARLQDLESRG